MCFLLQHSLAPQRREHSVSQKKLGFLGILVVSRKLGRRHPSYPLHVLFVSLKQLRPLTEGEMKAPG